MEEKINELMEQEEEYINEEMDFYERINERINKKDKRTKQNCSKHEQALKN